METLTREDFTRVANTGAGAFQTVMTHIVPRGEARKFVREAGRLNFGATQQFAPAGGTTTLTITAGSVVRSRQFKAYPVTVFRLRAGVTVQLTLVTAAPGANEFSYNETTQVITIAASTAGDVFDVYFPFSAGSYTVEVFSPSERRHDTYGNGTIQRLNSAPQDDINSMFSINSDTPWLLQDYTLRVQVNTATIVNHDDRNPYTLVELPYVRAPLAALPKEALAEAPMTLGL